jgi:hypothetical protein
VAEAVEVAAGAAEVEEVAVEEAEVVAVVAAEVAAGVGRRGSSR